jgi:hypothetical protein
MEIVDARARPSSECRGCFGSLRLEGSLYAKLELAELCVCSVFISGHTVAVLRSLNSKHTVSLSYCYNTHALQIDFVYVA